MPADGIKNALVKSADIFIEDHGILTAFLYLDFGGANQGFGGYSLDGKGANYAACFIRGVLDTLKLHEWSALAGKILRVETENGLLVAIGHPIEDRWFYPKREFEKLEQQAKR